MDRRGFLKGLISAGAVVALAPYLPKIGPARAEAQIVESFSPAFLPSTFDSINAAYYQQVANFVSRNSGKLSSLYGQRLYTTANLDYSPSWMNVSVS